MKTFFSTRLFLFAALLGACLSCKKETGAKAGTGAQHQPDTVTMVQRAEITKIDNGVEGYYIAYPSNYGQTTGNFPLLLFLHGAGQIGDGRYHLARLLQDGPAKMVQQGTFPGSIASGGKRFSFIIMTPQFSWWPGTSSIQACIDFARARYRIDASRIYLAGLSMGGMLTCDRASEAPAQIAAIVPMAGVSKDGDVKAKARNLARGGVPVWAFHSADDGQVGVQGTQNFVADINASQPRHPARLTVWPNGGHDAWTRALDANYRENGKNIYEWMLQYHR